MRGVGMMMVLILLLSAGADASAGIVFTASLVLPFAPGFTTAAAAGTAAAVAFVLG